MNQRRTDVNKVWVVVALVLLSSVASILRAQDVRRPADTTRHLQLADQGPRFLSAPTDGSSALDVSNAPVFLRRVTIDLVRVPLGDALRAVGGRAGIRFSYSRAEVPVERPVSVSATDITVAGALHEILLGLELDVQLSDKGLVFVVPRGGLRAGRLQQATGQIAGRVMDAMTRAPIMRAAVAIVGTSLSAVSGGDGRYAMPGIAAGSYHVTARRIGYQPMTKDVTVSADQPITVDFVLVPSAAVLNEVVTTVTGNEKRYQVGNLIETMRADSVVHTAPVTNLGDIVNARVPGVQVLNVGGVTGASPSINIRGQNSLSSSNQPLLVVDGVRAENSGATFVYGDPSNPATSIGYTGFGGVLQFGSFFGGRFNDLNPEDIENIEVVKGPSAATLYGTDAANGVILVTTKRGVAGAPRWDLSVEQGALTLNTDRFVDGWHAWGHTTDGTNTLEQCTLLLKAAGSCVIDSVTHFSSLKDPATTPVATGYRSRYAAQVSGGAQATHYFVSGTYEGETAPVKLPAPDRAILLRERGSTGLEPDNVRPNALTKGSARANLSTPLGRTIDLTVSSGLLSQEVRLGNSGFWYTGQATPGYRDVNDGWVYGFRPANIFALRNREDATHATGSANATWHPATWLQGRMTTGIDYSSDYLDVLGRPHEYYAGYPGQRSNGRVNIALYSVDLGATASTSLGSAFTSKTSVGAQYNHRAELDNVATAANLAPGVVSVAGGAVQTAIEANVETIVSGGYVEQEFGFRDRFFVTGAVRADGGSAFGAAFKTQVYPKFSASWLVSQEPWIPTIPGVSSLRLRAAYGSSGVQPGPTAALPQIVLSPATTPSGTMTAGVLGALGDLHLKPETQTELEVGADLEALNGRVQLGFTYYNKKSRDALVTLPVGTQLGIATTSNSLFVFNGSQETNLGSVRNRGYELSASADVVRSRPIDWSIAVNGSNNQNRLVSLAPGINAVRFGQSPVGSPLFGLYDIPFTFKDANGDGVIEPTEITPLTSGPVFLGSSFPTGQATFSSTLGVLREAVQLRVQVDRRSGVKLQDLVRDAQSFVGDARGANDPRAPLADQAAIQAFLGPFNSSAGFLEDASFTRLREISVTFNAPPGMLRVLRGRSASLTLAGRNLVLWTRYRGADPEVNSSPAGNSAGSGAQAYYDVGAAPASRYWIARVRVGL